MPIRIRCPECRTVLDVAAGIRPRCPRCGFAGRARADEPGSATAAPSGAQFTRISSSAPAASQVEWDEGEGAQAASPQWPAASPEEWPEDRESGEWETGQDAWQTAEGTGPTEEEAAWQSAEAEWAPPAGAPAPAAKKGWFRKG